MIQTHLLSWVCSVVAGACFLLVAFGVEAAGSVGLLPIGLLFFVAAFAVCHHHHA